MKNIRIFKRLTITLMAALLLALAGCKGGGESSGSGEPDGSQQSDRAEKPTLTVCMDLGYDQTPEKLQDIVREYAPEFKDSYKLKIEPIPDGNRDASMDRIRVEMMAGKGPDLFLCMNPQATIFFPSTEKQALFQYPKALMKRHMFLPLDDYIENAKYMEWDKLYPEIMAAGKNDDGQQILPISWMMNFTGIPAESYELPDDIPMTFEEMLESDDPGIIAATRSFNYCDSLGQLADYEHDAPAFTIEELTAHLEGLSENRKLRTKEFLESLDMPKSMEFSRHNFTQSQGSQEYVLIPQYNRQGGATAYISTFGAVNINSKVPEAAFEILDLLLSKDVQKLSDLLMYDPGAPVHMELPRKKVRIETESGGKFYKNWSISEHNDQQLQTLIKQINAVDFFTPVHYELSELYSSYMQAETKEEREKLVAEAYKNIDMMLAES